MSCIEARGLTRAYGKHVAVKGIDLTVERGALWG
jgi:ABC-type multidrug transport system ATPase subunit